MKKYLIISFLSLTLFLTGCDFLGQTPDEYASTNDAFGYENTYQKNVNQCYAYIKNGYNRVDGAFLDAATDDGTATMQSSNIHKLGQGFQSSSSTIESCWSNSYDGISQTLFTQKYLTEVSLFLNGKTDAQVKVIKDNCIAQALGLRALYEFDLLRHYGGYPIMDHFMEFTDPAFKTLKRNSFEECVKNIVYLCDTARTNLNVADAEFGRMEKGTVLAIKAKTLVFAASALYNQSTNQNPLLGYINPSPVDIQARWEKAAEACAAVINLKNGAANRYALSTNYATLFNTCPNNEFIAFFDTPKSNALENRQYPFTLSKTQGGGSVPSQQFVDAFTNSDGSTYSRAINETPNYTTRDKRFAQIIGYNGSTYGTTKIYTQLGTGETADGLNKQQDRSTTTGYYLKKFLDTSINFSIGTPVTTFHLFPIIRLADIYLLYAEAMTQAYGFEADPIPFGLTAKAAVQKVRTRAGFSTTDKYYDGATDKVSQLQKIYDERRIELCFEECRYFDLRRWMLTDVLKQPIKGMKIQNDNGLLTYSDITVDDKRTFEDKMYFTPIPLTETQIFTGLQQNPGW